MTNKQCNSNGLVGGIYNYGTRNPKIHRILSMLIDHIIMCLIVVPLAILIFVFVLNFEDNLNKEFGIALIFIPFFIYLNKDFFNAKSPAKRILGYQVIDRKTNSPANELQCFIRNLTICIAWPLEVVISLLSPKRRIGDFFANTKVIASEKEKLKSIWTDLKSTTLKLNFIGILVIGGFYFYGLSLMWPNMN
ncbi:RDD family protein [Tenacibaculum ovolyticum]|uniref:RDD family protein n=1 Tax=Tenacibaculum ovolyticum TaxID=104270 RepID=UPI0003FE1AB0|nr:RDD family protein [Tenacibaculum ovolyticum]